jgi:hypothetical protein
MEAEDKPIFLSGIIILSARGGNSNSKRQEVNIAKARNNLPQKITLMVYVN